MLFYQCFAKPVRFLLPVVLLFAQSVSAQSFDRLFVFGDSLSDVGNLASVTTGQFPYPYYQGRVSNGPLATDVLAQRLGVSNTPSLHLPGAGGGAGGRNFAVAGANAGSLDEQDLKFQVDAFVAKYGSVNLSNSLAVLVIGGNDVRGARDAQANAASIVLAAANAINGSLQRIAASGVGAILVVNAPDISRIPETRLRAAQSGNGAQLVANARLYTNQLNTLIKQHASSLRTSYAGNVFEFDLYTFVNGVLDNPMGFGFSNVIDGCFSISPIRFHPDCRFGLNFNAFAFFDNIHPTAKLHGLIGEAMFDALKPEPVDAAPVVITPLLMYLLAD